MNPCVCSFENCKRKLPLTVFPCKCKLLFCDNHRYSEEHKCTYKYYEEAQDIMKKTLSTIVFTKKEVYETI